MLEKYFIKVLKLAVVDSPDMCWFYHIKLWPHVSCRLITISMWDDTLFERTNKYTARIYQSIKSKAFYTLHYFLGVFTSFYSTYLGCNMMRKHKNTKK